MLHDEDWCEHTFPRCIVVVHDLAQHHIATPDELTQRCLTAAVVVAAIRVRTTAIETARPWRREQGRHL